MNNDIIGNLDYYSDKISTQLRTISIGLLSFSWLFLSNNKDALSSLSVAYRPSFYAISSLALFALLLDFIHYIIGYINSKSAMENGHYAPESKIARAQASLFWLKIFPIMVACAWLIFILANGLA